MAIWVDWSATRQTITTHHLNVLCSKCVRFPYVNKALKLGQPLVMTGLACMKRCTMIQLAMPPVFKVVCPFNVVDSEQVRSDRQSFNNRHQASNKAKEPGSTVPTAMSERQASTSYHTSYLVL